MAKSNSQRQADYRKRQLRDKGSVLNVEISAQTKSQMTLLAACFGYTQRQLIEGVIRAEHHRLRQQAGAARTPSEKTPGGKNARIYLVIASKMKIQLERLALRYGCSQKTMLSGLIARLEASVLDADAGPAARLTRTTQYKQMTLRLNPIGKLELVLTAAQKRALSKAVKLVQHNLLSTLSTPVSDWPFGCTLCKQKWKQMHLPVAISMKPLNSKLRDYCIQFAARDESCQKSQESEALAQLRASYFWLHQTLGDLNEAAGT